MDFEKYEEGDLLKDPNGKVLELFGLKYTEMVYVESGSFFIGDNTSQFSNEKPEKLITFKSGYFIGKYLVTQELYKTIMGINPSKFIGRHRPVECISFMDIHNEEKSFLSVLNRKINKKYPFLKGKFKLPSESQWEYACRGGKNWNKPKLEYAGSNDCFDVAWFDENSNGQTMPVGLKQPNELDIYDMSGNTWEWCEDWHIPNYKKIPHDGSPFLEDVKEIKETNGKKHKVLRGGMWFGYADNCKVAFRFDDFAENLNNDISFRLVYIP